MKTRVIYLMIGFMIGIITVSCNQAQQRGEKNPFQATYKMTTDIPASITTPDVVETSLGTLRFFDGFPDSETVKKVYDNLDFQRGVQAFLAGIPPRASQGYSPRYSQLRPRQPTSFSF